MKVSPPAPRDNQRHLGVTAVTNDLFLQVNGSSQQQKTKDDIFLQRVKNRKNRKEDQTEDRIYTFSKKSLKNQSILKNQHIIRSGEEKDGGSNEWLHCEKVKFQRAESEISLMVS